MEPKIYQQGYVALISAIIISAVLILISVGASATGFFSRFNVLDGEYKERGNQLAEACVDSELLRLSQNPGDATTGNVSVGSDSCTVFAVLQNSPSTGEVTIETKAVVEQSVTNIKVVVAAGSLNLISWQELPNL
jgi:hypothetical protein